MDRVLVVFPTAWDERNLLREDRPLAGDVELVFAEPSDADCPADLDVLRFIDEAVRTWRGRIQGVFSSSDYPGATVAAAIATALGLPGSHPDTVMRSSHKYESRLAQRRAAPEAVPPFALVDPRRADGGRPALDYPCFVKPVKGTFSVLARKVAGQRELEAYLAQPCVRPFVERTMLIFNALVARYGRFEHDGGWFIAEGLLRGDLVTVEGFATRDGVSVLGVIDSALDPSTGSFLRFDYPSALPDEVQRRMEDIARRIVRELGLVDSLFNIEMMHDPATGALGVIEVNPRMCGQFADLYEKVDGVHGHALALELALGRPPTVRRRAGPCGAAASVPLRAFGPIRVVRAPDAREIAAVEAGFAGARVWSECVTGTEFADLETEEDGSSVRYAVINAGARDRAALERELDAIRTQLDFRVAPL